MEGLLAYEDTATIIATLYAEKEPRKSGSSGAEKGLYDLGTYLAQLIRALHGSLMRKIDGLQRSDTTLRAIFLLNNVNYLLKRLEKY